MVEQIPIIRNSSFDKEAYRGLATAQMRILKDYMKVGGLSVYSRVITLANGVVITCQKSFNREDIFISAPSVALVSKVIKTIKEYILLYTYTNKATRYTEPYNVMSWFWYDLSRWLHYDNEAKQVENSIELPNKGRQDEIPQQPGYTNWQDGKGNSLSWYWSGGRYTPDGARGTTLFNKYGTAYPPTPGDILGAGVKVGKDINGNDVSYVLVAIENGGLYYLATNTDTGVQTWEIILGITFETNPVYFTYSGGKCAYVYVYDGLKRYDRHNYDSLYAPGSTNIRKSEFFVINILGYGEDFSVSVSGTVDESPTNEYHFLSNISYGTSYVYSEGTADRTQEVASWWRVGYSYDGTGNTHVYHGSYYVAYVDAAEDIIVGRVFIGSVTDGAQITGTMLLRFDQPQTAPSGPWPLTPLNWTYTDLSSTNYVLTGGHTVLDGVWVGPSVTHSYTGVWLIIGGVSPPDVANALNGVVPEVTTNGNTPIRVAVAETLYSGGTQTAHTEYEESLHPTLFDLRTSEKVFAAYVSREDFDDTRENSILKRGMYILPKAVSKETVWELTQPYLVNNIWQAYEVDNDLDLIKGKQTATGAYPHIVTTDTIVTVLKPDSEDTRVFISVLGKPENTELNTPEISQSLLLDGLGEDVDPDDKLEIKNKFFGSYGFVTHTKETTNVA